MERGWSQFTVPGGQITWRNMAGTYCRARVCKIGVEGPVHQIFKRPRCNGGLEIFDVQATLNPEEAVESAMTPVEDPRWLLAERVAASPAFVRSPRLAQLLLYLCRRRLAEQGDQLSEQAIAVEVFGRGFDFDSASDTIVRSHMLRLRQRLEAYFREEGAGEELRITIPRGRYVPSFQPKEAVEETAAGVPARDGDEVEAPPARSAGPFGWMALGAVLLCVAGLIVFTGWRVAGAGKRVPYPAMHQFWGRLFPAHSETLLVAADSGLVLLHGITGENTTLSEYAAHDLGHAAASAVGMKPETALSLASRRYTSFVDLELFNRVTHVPEALSGSYSIRYARDISINELKDANAIFSGSADANPWVETFEQEMNFVLQDNLREGMRSFVNRKPQAGEPAKYVTGNAEYGVLAFLSNPSGNGNVLIIEGTSVAGTESASDFLFDSHEFEPFLESIRKADGTVPHFEVLVATESLNGSAAPSRVVAWRVR